MSDRSPIAVIPTPAGPHREHESTLHQSGGPSTIATPAPIGVLKTESTGTIGDYEIQDKLGEGGMGAVYRGWDLQLRRSVAIKVLLPEYSANREARERFLREARSAAAVTHDNVVTIHHVGDHRGSAYLVMPLLKGMSLETFFQKKGLPTIPQAIRIAREIAAGLGAAHKGGLIHRDVKPGNIWLESPNGRVKILDFGIAKPMDSAKQSAITEAGVVMGTPAFMSPEQARGHAVDLRSDLFSLGAILYRMVTGVPPFSRPTVMETLTALVSERPRPVREFNPAVPPDLAELIHRLLAGQPRERLDSADAVIKALRQIERNDSDKRKSSGPIPDVAAVRISGDIPTIPVDSGFEVVGDQPESNRKTGRRKKKRERPTKITSWSALVAGACVVAVAVVALVVFGIVKAVSRMDKQPEKPAVLDNPVAIPADPPAVDANVADNTDRPNREFHPFPPPHLPPPPGFGPRPPFGKFPPPPRDRP